MGLGKKLAKKNDSDLLDVFFNHGGRVTADGFVPHGEDEAQIALSLLARSDNGRALLTKAQQAFNDGKITKRGAPREEKK